MLAEERQNQLYALINKDGAITTADAAQIFQVSIETIRKDLLHMHAQGIITKTHGGAVRKSSVKPALTYSVRIEENEGLKHQVAHKAAEYVQQGDVIGIDEGSTALAFAEVLRNRCTNLTVITYSLDVLQVLSENKGIRVILCGGEFMPEEKSFIGLQTIQMLRNLHMQKAFLFPTSVSIGTGICGYCAALIQLQQQMIESAEQVFVLADSSKFEKHALYKAADLDYRYIYITDSELPQQIRQLYKEENIQLVIGGEK